MISKQAKYFCSEDLSKIENYEEAVSSPEKWHLHHRLELDQNGHRLNTRDELKEKGLYFHRPASELIFLKDKDHHKLHMSDEQRERISNAQLKSWEKPSRRRKLRVKIANKRENGEYLINIEQMKSDEDYREYQKLYQRMYYDEHSTEWKDYLTRRRYATLPTEKLVDMLRQKRLSVSLAPERKERLVNFILDELRNRKDVAEHFLYDITLDRDELKDISDKIEETNRG